MMIRSYANYLSALLIILLLLCMLVLTLTVSERRYMLVLRDDFSYRQDSDAQANWIVIRNSSSCVVWTGNGVVLVNNSSNCIGGLFLKSIDLASCSLWEARLIIKLFNGSEFLILFSDVPKFNLSRAWFIEFDLYKDDEDHDPSIPHISLMRRCTNHMKCQVSKWNSHVNIPIDKWIYVLVRYVEGNLTLVVWNEANLELKSPQDSIVIRSTFQRINMNGLSYLGLICRSKNTTTSCSIKWFELFIEPKFSKLHYMKPNVVTKTVTRTILAIKRVTYTDVSPLSIEVCIVSAVIVILGIIMGILISRRGYG